MRPMVSRKWIRHPRGLWTFGFVGNPIIGDPGHTYAGSPEVFAKLSHRHDRFQGLHRPMFLLPAIAALVGMVYRQGGLLPHNHPVRFSVQLYTKNKTFFHSKAA